MLPPTNRPCVVQVRTVHFRTGDTSDWRTANDPWRRKPMRFRSKRAALRGLADALYTTTDHLSSHGYQVRFLFDDGAHQLVRESAVEHAMQIAHEEQHHNSIGECLRRGEAVFV